ncbi:hypothetical protein FS837_000828 [Tulasnella sp. UAMH 9824]|nr:hypothetical protein FS837_000828 [Tulasnella sp. UAMH 9824]
MSQTLQDLVISMDALDRAPGCFVITSFAGVSLEQFLRDVHLPKELEDVIDVQFNTEELGSTRFVVTCPDYWVWNEVLLHVSLLDQQYDVDLEKTLTFSPGSVAGGSGGGVATPTLESTSRPSTTSTPSNGSVFSPWETVNPLQSPVWDAQQSPLINPGNNNTLDSFSALSEADPATASPGTEFQSPNRVLKREEYSNEDFDFFGATEGDDEYVEEWPWSAKNGDTKEENAEGDAETFSSEASRKQRSQSSSSRYSNEEEEGSAIYQKTEGRDMDLETTEDDKANGHDEDPLPSSDEVDRSEADSAQDLHQIQQQLPSPRVFTSPSNRDGRYMQASVAVGASPPRNHTRITESGPTADAGPSSTIEGSSSALPEPENDDVSDDIPEEEAAEVDDLIQAMFAMAATLSGDEGTANPGVAPNGQWEEDSPNTSTESATVLKGIQEEFHTLLGVNPSAMMGPDVHESVGDEQD